jgi:micrococcal nuclease
MFGCFKAKPWTFVGQTRRATVIDVYDGDTITVAFWVGWQRYSFKFRLSGIDTPEIRTKNRTEKALGIAAKEYLEDCILHKSVKLVFADSEDKYGRLMGTVMLRGEDINQKLVDKGYAKKYDGGAKKDVGWNF